MIIRKHNVDNKVSIVAKKLLFTLNAPIKSGIKKKTAAIFKLMSTPPIFIFSPLY